MTNNATIAIDAATTNDRLVDRVGFWIALHILVWTFYAMIGNGAADIHHDMAEAYAWGREFQLGYFKHPPFWAWVAGLWFAMAPRADWAFYLLSMVNAGLGLWAVWLIAGRLIANRKLRLCAVLLLELTPFYHFLGFKFNANTILLSLWPWATYFFLRVLEDRDPRAAIGLGIVAGLDDQKRRQFLRLTGGDDARDRGVPLRGFVGEISVRAVLQAGDASAFGVAKPCGRIRDGPHADHVGDGRIDIVMHFGHAFAIKDRRAAMHRRVRFHAGEHREVATGR